MRVTEIETGRHVDLEVANGCFSRVTEASTVGVAGGWVLPGLVDVHNHLSLASPAGDHAEPGERVRASASLELALGVLALREPGSPDDASAALAGEPGWPLVITAGRFLAPPGGISRGWRGRWTKQGWPPPRSRRPPGAAGGRRSSGISSMSSGNSHRIGAPPA